MCCTLHEVVVEPGQVSTHDQEPVLVMRMTTFTQCKLGCMVDQLRQVLSVGLYYHVGGVLKQLVHQAIHLFLARVWPLVINLHLQVISQVIFLTLKESE